MRYLCLVCLLLASLTFAQTAPPTPPPAASPAAGAKADDAPPAPAKAPEVKVAPDDVVLTIKDFCPNTKQTGDACKTTMTRAQFEKLADALQPNMSPAIRRQLANRYSMILRMGTEAEKRGLDKDATFEEKMQFARLQILSQELGTALQADSNKISDAEVEDYYKKNLPSYETATFSRIIVPKSKQIPPPTPAASTKPGEKKTAPTPPAQPTEAQKKAAEEAMSKLAATLRERAAKGEDPDKLQKEAYAAAGLKGNAPNTKIENVRHNTLPANQQSVMDLKVGEVSAVISDPNSGHYIYIMVSKETMPLDKAAPEIKRTLSSQRYRDSMQAFQKDVDLNDAYFGGAPRGPSLPPLPRAGRPPAGQSQDPDKDDRD